MPDPLTHDQFCEVALRTWANNPCDDFEIEVMAWALSEIEHLRARVAELEKQIELERLG